MNQRRIQLQNVSIVQWQWRLNGAKIIANFPKHLFIHHIFKTFEGIRSIWYLSIPPYKISTESIKSIIATVSHLSQLLIHFFRKRPEILGSFFQHWVINLKWEIHMISLSAALDWPRLCLCLALFYVLVLRNINIWAGNYPTSSICRLMMRCLLTSRQGDHRHLRHISGYCESGLSNTMQCVEAPEKYSLQGIKGIVGHNYRCWHQFASTRKSLTNLLQSK